MRGSVTIVQEGRFQMTDDSGVSHLFVLSPHAAAEPGELTALQARQARIRVRFSAGPNMIGNVAHAIELEG